MGIEFFSKSYAASKILKLSGSFKQNVPENTLSFSQRIFVGQVTLYFRAFASIPALACNISSVDEGTRSNNYASCNFFMSK
jgi:hypothetical protein